MASPLPKYPNPAACIRTAWPTGRSIAPAGIKAARQRVNSVEIMSAGPHIPTLQTDRLLPRAPQMGGVQSWIEFANSRRAGFVGGPSFGLAKGWRGLARDAGAEAAHGGTIRVDRHPTPEARP